MESASDILVSIMYETGHTRKGLLHEIFSLLLKAAFLEEYSSSGRREDGHGNRHRQGFRPIPKSPNPSLRPLQINTLYLTKECYQILFGFNITILLCLPPIPLSTPYRHKTRPSPTTGH